MPNTLQMHVEKEPYTCKLCGRDIVPGDYAVKAHTYEGLATHPEMPLGHKIAAFSDDVLVHARCPETVEEDGA